MSCFRERLCKPVDVTQLSCEKGSYMKDVLLLYCTVLYCTVHPARVL